MFGLVGGLVLLVIGAQPNAQEQQQQVAWYDLTPYVQQHQAQSTQDKTHAVQVDRIQRPAPPSSPAPQRVAHGALHPSDISFIKPQELFRYFVFE